MKLEIELDLNKIDYDAINKQIAEKVAELNIKREVMLKIIPDVFASILFRRMESALFSSEQNYYNQIYNMVRGEINSRIR